MEEVAAGSTTAQVSYTYGNDLLSQNISGISTSTYHYDGLGSTRSLTDSTGIVTDAYGYTAFGRTENQDGLTSNDYLFAGEQYDSNLGFYYLRARYYNAAIGHFQTMDTFVGRMFEPASLHNYLYANVNPVNLVDPTGKFGIGSITSGINISGVLTTISVASSAFSVVNAATDEDGLTAKEFGFAVLIAAAGPAGGKLAKIIAPKFAMLGKAAQFSYLRRRAFAGIKSVRPRSVNQVSLPVGGITSIGTKTINSLQEDKVYIYVVDKSNKLIVALRGSAGRSGVKHTQLNGGEAVKAAGELIVSGGTILLNNESGRYRAQSPSAVNKVKMLLQSLGKSVDLSGPL